MTTPPTRRPGRRAAAARARRASRPLGEPAQCRVLFSGPPGVGKTTAVESIARSGSLDPLEQPRRGAPARPHRRAVEAVGDYTLWRPAADLSVAVVGAPARERFETALPTLLSPWTRVVLWLHGDRRDVTGQAEDWLGTLGTAAVPRLVIAVTRTADGAQAVRSRLTPLLREHRARSVPVLPADPRDPGSVRDVVSTALDLPESADPAP